MVMTKLMHRWFGHRFVKNGSSVFSCGCGVWWTAVPPAVPRDTAREMLGVNWVPHIRAKDHVLSQATGTWL